MLNSELRLAREAELASVLLDRSDTRLRGTELLEMIMRTGEVSKAQLATICGYSDANGRIYFTEFYTAVLEAKGITQNTI